MKHFVSGLLALVLTSPVFAHPGHGVAGSTIVDGIIHLFSSPEHLAVLLAPLVLVLGVWVAKRWHARSQLAHPHAQLTR